MAKLDNMFDSQDNQNENIQEEQKLNKYIQQSTQVLIHIKPAALLDFAPDEITVDLNKVNIITRELLGEIYINSILISEITDINIEVATLATIKFTEAHNKVITTVSKFHYQDADKVRNIVQGIIIASKDNIDLTKIDPSVLPEKLEELGQVVLKDKF